MEQKKFLAIAGMVLAVVIIVGTILVLSDDESASPEPTQQTGNRWSALVSVSEYEFDTGPLSALPPGEAAFEVSVVGDQPHEFQIFKLLKGVDFLRFQDAVRKIGPEPRLFEYGLPVGGVGAGGGIAPGSSARVVLDLELGSYAFVSFVNNDHRKGMIKKFDVLKGEPAPAGLPPTEGTIELSDDGFHLPDDQLSAGMYSLVNKGSTVHEAAVFEVTETIDDLSRDLAAGDETQGSAGLSRLAPGLLAFGQLNLPAGTYAFVCRATNPSTGEPFYRQGMLQEFEIP